MTDRELTILNSLVTYAAENIPGGLTEDERDVTRVVGQWALNGVYVRPVCPHCGSVTPFGDERVKWLEAHIDSRVHRWWWDLRNKF